MDKYYKKFFNFISENSLIQKNDKIVIAVSGGYDSIALTLLLNRLKDELKLKLLIAHLNHKIRGNDSTEDKKFVKLFAQKLNIDFIGVDIDIPLLKEKRKKKSLEEIAREERYKFLQNVCRNNNFNKIATGHHINDSIENFFLTVLIEGGVKGLSGVPVKNGNIIRPLLCFTKPDLIKIVKISGHTPRIDKSNFDVHIPRNWIRHKLLPFIQYEFKPFQKHLINLMDIIKIENEFIEEKVNDIVNRIDYMYGINLPEDLIRKEHKAVVRRVLKKVLTKLGYKNISYNLINLIDSGLNLNNVKVNDLTIWKYGNKIYFTRKNFITRYKYKFEDNDYLIIKEIKYSVEKKLINKKVDKYKKNCIYIDSKKIEQIVVRSKNKGDKIRLMNTKYLKSLKELFIDLKIPKILRDIIPVIEINGEVAGIYLNFEPIYLTNKISDEYKVTDKTEEIITLNFKEKI